MTQKEAEEILRAAGWVIQRELLSFSTWVCPNALSGVTGVDIWKDMAHERLWRAEANKANFARIPSDLLIPKVIADVMRHCS